MSTTMNATVLNWDDDWISTNIRPKKDEQIKLDLDLLVLSCALYRLRNMDYVDPVVANRYRCLSLIDDNIQQYVINEDYDLADKVREHFSKKLMMLKLKSTQLTPFREELNKFLHSNWHQDPAGVFIYPKNYVGIAYKLPYFYEYDNKLYSLAGSSHRSVKGPESTIGQKKLNFLGKVDPQTRRQSINYEFWFEDESDNMVMISLEKQNPLLSVFDKMVEGPVTLEGRFDIRSKDTVQYYNSLKWKCVV